MAVALDTGCNLSTPHIVKVRDLLPEHSREILGTHALALLLGRVVPDQHVGVVAHEDAEANDNQPDSIHTRVVLELALRVVQARKQLGRRARAPDLVRDRAKVRERDGELAKDQRHEGLRGADSDSEHDADGIQEQLERRREPEHAP